MKTVISTPNAPGAIGPYSQGYAFGDLVITSGQIPVDPATGAIPEGIAAQAEQSLPKPSSAKKPISNPYDYWY